MAPFSKLSESQTLNAFDVVPVLDLKDGAVVHARAGKYARAGKRAEYRPIATPFGPPHDAPAIGRALLGITFSPILYIADLNAILGQGHNFELCQSLADAVPDTELWIDAGFSNLEDYAFWQPLGATLVIGSETIESLSEWETIRGSLGNNVVLSLDFDEEGVRGPKGLMDDPALWPSRLILMSLGRVGTETGPDLVQLGQMLEAAEDCQIEDCQIYVAGGVASSADVVAVANAGARGVLAATALHSGAIRQKEIAALLGERRSRI